LNLNYNRKSEPFTIFATTCGGLPLVGLSRRYSTTSSPLWYRDSCSSEILLVYIML